jgi:hypothetical protein
MAKQNKKIKFLVTIAMQDTIKTKEGKQLAKHVQVVRTALLASQVVYSLVLPGLMQMVRHAMHVQWVHTVLLVRVHQQRGGLASATNCSVVVSETTTKMTTVG